MRALRSCVGLLVVLHLAAAASDTQTPRVTQCSGVKNVSVRIVNVTITNAKLGKKIKFDATVLVKTTVGQNPVLELSFSQSDGTKIPCVDEVVPCNLSLCDGTTRIEKHLNKDWDNTCPVQRGTYSAELEFRLPGSEAKKYFGDGRLQVTVKIVDNGQLLGCAQYPLQIDVN